jgi:suppressor for copper-sensitivity B
MGRLRPLLAAFSVVVSGLSAVPPAWAQLGGDPSGGFGGGFGPGADQQVVAVTGQFTAPTADEPARLFITAKVKPGWHIYSITQAPGGVIPTRIKLEESKAYRLLGDFQASPPPKKKAEPVFDNLVVESHYGTVVWHAPMELAPQVDPGKLNIEGSLYAQPCTETSCLPPQHFPFTARLGQGVDLPEPRPEVAQPPAAVPPSVPGPRPQARTRLAWKPFTTLQAFGDLISSDGATFDPEQVRQNVQKQLSGTSIFYQIALAFVGGMILNLMPCVLPVIGLKVLSFVEQSGQDRRRALMLNVWYSAGLMSVFLLLAVLAVFLGYGWGQLFKFSGFSVALAVVVFAMGLSFLGVWEVPIPGFVGSGKAVELAKKEGMSGAFAKGVLTTILATPCTGPFMASALAWATRQPPATTLAVFISVGLGMASPYLLIGAFPRLIRFLPKPGAWMETFKQIMGFVLMGTVVFIFTFMEWSYVVPTIGLLFAVWAACWWIGRTPATAGPGRKSGAWLEAAAFGVLCWILLFPGVDEITSGRFALHGLHDEMKSRLESKVDLEVAGRFQELTRPREQPQETEVVAQAPAELNGPRPVLIDFTADWCLTCKTLEATMLNTAEVREAVERHGVVTLKADWTHEAPEVTRFLEILGGKGVPVVAVFSPADPNNPIVFRDGYTKQMVLDALEKAGRAGEAS